MTEKEAAEFPCGLYRTTRESAGIPAGRLVYFHNHGTPGPGLYLPASWALNKATFHENGHTLPEPWATSARTLEPLLAEGFYQVVKPFHCCEKRCREFKKGLFVQLGYNGAATPLVFVPQLSPSGIAIPEVGTPVDPATLDALSPIQVQTSSASHSQDDRPQSHLH